MKEKIKLTELQIDKAIGILERQIIGAVTLFFEQRDNVWVQTLATAARPQIEKITKDISGIQLETKFISQLAQEKYPDKDQKTIYKELKRPRDIMTHPDNPDNHAEDFYPENLDFSDLLFQIINDFMQLLIKSEREIRPEISAFSIWFMAKDTDMERGGQSYRDKFKILRDLPNLEYRAQIEIGRRFLQWLVSLDPIAYCEAIQRPTPQPLPKIILGS